MTHYIVVVNSRTVVRNSRAKLAATDGSGTYREIAEGSYEDITHLANSLNQEEK